MSGNEAADLIFVNGAVYTVDAARSWAQAVAVREGRIVAVGTDADVRELAGPTTEVVDLAGRMLVPGFQDAHVHPVGGGVDMLQCDLHDLSTAEEYLASDRRVRGVQPGRPVDPRRRLVDGRLPRRDADGGRARRGRGGPARLPARTATATAAG